jgi:transcriptional regulator with XRE-family HTH domain
MLRLRQLREGQGLNRAQLARAAAIGDGNYCTLESGMRKPWGPERHRLAEALGWEGDPEELFEEVTDDAAH